MIRTTRREAENEEVYALCASLGNRCTCRRTGHVCESLVIRARQKEASRKELRRVEFNTKGARIYQWYQEKMG